MFATGADPEIVYVTALDRLGNESKPAIEKLKSGDSVKAKSKFGESAEEIGERGEKQLLMVLNQKNWVSPRPPFSPAVLPKIAGAVLSFRRSDYFGSFSSAAELMQ
jgi:hypothetical protein